MDIIEFIKTQEKTKKQTMEDLKDYHNQTLATQSIKGAELTAKVAVYNEAIYMMGDVIYDQGIEIDVLKDKIGNIDDGWLQKSLVY